MVRVQGVPDEEITAVLTGKKGPTERRTYRLSAEARRILEVEGERLGLDEAKTLELLLREVRELRKRRR